MPLHHDNAASTTGAAFVTKVEAKRARLKRFGFALITLSLSAGLVSAEAAYAQVGIPGRAPQRSPAWCGVTSDGGTIALELTLDGRFVTGVNVNSSSQTVSTAEGGCSAKTAIKTDQFIMRCGGGGARRRCERAPCRGDGVGSQSASLRGRFLDGSSNLVKGTYQGFIAQVTVGRRTSSRPVNGTYVAWPIDEAPCP
jgi:hypothetical protein